MKKSFVVLMLIVLVGTLSFANGNKEVTSVKVGFIGPMTGDNANYGVYCNNATKLAIEHANAAGGIDGLPIELITEDSEGVPDKALACIDKLSSSDKIVALVGPVFTGTSFAVAERCVNEGLMMCTPSATHKDITSIGDYVFRTVVSDGLQGEVAGYYFAQVLGYKNLAVLYAKNDYSQGLYEGMKESFEKAGGQITIAETCMVGDKDFKTQLTKIKNANPDAIYIPNYTVENAQILEQAAQLGIDLPFLSSDGFSNQEIYGLTKNTDGVVYVAPAQVKESDALKNFQNEFEKKYGNVPDSFATNAYDATNILVSVLKQVYKETGKFDRTDIRNAFANVKDFPGVTGNINFAPNGDLIAYQGIYKVEGQTPVYQGAYAVENGKLVKIDD